MPIKAKYLFIILVPAVFFTASPYFVMANELVKAARDQIGKTLSYDPGYQVLDYPDGDVPIDRGVCTDVLIRALRQAYDFDLQQLVHEDMQANFSQYPKIWGQR